MIDDAQGWGYKTKKKATAAMWWKFKGGKQKADQQEKEFKEWKKKDPLHDKIIFILKR